MSIRPAFDPYGGCAPQVDKMIGSAFPIVEKVANNLDAINYLVSNMNAIVQVAENFQMEVTTMVTAVAPAAGESISIPLPEGVTIANIRASNVLLVTTTGNIYNMFPGHGCTAVIIAGELVVAFTEGAHPSFEGGELRWHITYGI